MLALPGGMRRCLQNARHQSTASAEVACRDIGEPLQLLMRCFGLSSSMMMCVFRSCNQGSCSVHKSLALIFDSKSRKTFFLFSYLYLSTLKSLRY